MGLEMMWCAYFRILKRGVATLASHAPFIQSEIRQKNFASEWLKYFHFVSRWTKYRVFQKSYLKSSKWAFSKMLTLIFINDVIVYLGRGLFEPLGITFLEKILYFAYLLVKRENLSHSEAKFICQFWLCMKCAWQASVATPFFKIRK